MPFCHLVSLQMEPTSSTAAQTQISVNVVLLERWFGGTKRGQRLSLGIQALRSG